MALTSLGDMARHFIGLRDITASRNALVRLNSEVVSGRTTDAVRHLDGRADRLFALNHKIATLGAEQKAAAALGHRLQSAREVTTTIEATRADLSQTLLSLPMSVTPKGISRVSAEAEGALQGMISALSTRQGPDYIFSGAKSDAAPFAPVADIVTQLRTLAAGAQSADEVRQLMQQAFTAPGGLFETDFYQGATGAEERRDLGQGVQVGLGPRADDPAFRSLMASYATAMIVADEGFAISDTAKAEALHNLGADLVAVAEPLSVATAHLGGYELLAEQISAARGAGVTAAVMQRQDLVGVDQAASISALDQMQAQLEIQYTVTARLSGMSLAGYLR